MDSDPVALVKAHSLIPALEHHAAENIKKMSRTSKLDDLEVSFSTSHVS